MSDQDMAQRRFCLSQEELLFLTRLLSLPHLPGMSSFPYEGLNDQTIEHLIEAGGRALLSREILAVSPEQQLVLDRAVQAVLLACTHPNQRTSITTRAGKGEPVEQVNYYRVPEFTIRHTPVVGLHWFEFSEDQGMGLPYVVELVEKHAFNVSVPAFDFDQAELDQILERASTSSDSVTRYLMERGFPVEYAEKFVSALTEMQYRVQIDCLDREDQEIMQDGLTLLAGEGETWWAFFVGDRATHKITVQGLTTQEALVRIQDSFALFAGVIE